MTSKPSYEDLAAEISDLKAELENCKKAEWFHKRSRERYDELIQNVSSIILRLDTDGKITFLNRHGQNLLGFTEEELLGKNLIGTIVPTTDSTGKDLTEMFRELLCNPELYLTNENENVKKNGERVWVAWTNAVIRDDTDSVVEILCIGNDISGRIEAEQALKKAYGEMERRVDERTEELLEKNSALKQEIEIRRKVESELRYAKMQAESANQIKSEFLANMSHELRTPLHHVLMYSRFGVEKSYKPKKQLVHYFENIRNSGEKLRTLLDDLLNLTYLEDDRVDFDMSTCDLVKAAELGIVEHQKKLREKEIDIILKPPDIDTSLVCDFNQIRQVFRKLISNAIKYTPNRNTVSISFSKTSVEYTKSVDETLEIPAIAAHVRDGGIGIPEDELETIFDKFHQSSITKTGAGGKGLGLSICRLIINAHHGRIWAENNPDLGATFSFALPYTPV